MPCFNRSKACWLFTCMANRYYLSKREEINSLHSSKKMCEEICKVMEELDKTCHRSCVYFTAVFAQIFLIARSWITKIGSTAVITISIMILVDMTDWRDYISIRMRRIIFTYVNDFSWLSTSCLCSTGHLIIVIQ